MKGLIIKDIYNLRKSISMYCAIVALLVAYCLFAKKIVFLPMIPVLIFSTMITGAFAKDNSTKWDKFSVTLPLTRTRIVWSRYVLFAIIIGFGSLIGILAMAITLMNGDVKFISEIELLLLSVEISLISGGVSLLLLFTIKSIIDKLELVTVISYIVGAAVTFGGYKLLNMFISSKVFMFSVGVVIGIVFVIISCKISVSAFNRREFD